MNKRLLSPFNILAFIILLGLTLRLWGNDFGMPHFYAPDEAYKIRVAFHFKDCQFQYDFNQPHFLYGSLYLIFQGIKALEPIVNLNLLFAKLGIFHWRGEMFFLWIGRSWMAILGALTVWAVYLLGKETWNKKAGLWAAFFYAVAPLPVISAHYIKEDTPLVLWITLFFVMCVRIIKDKRFEDYCWAALIAGLAAGSKYAGAFTILFLFIAHRLSDKDREIENHTGIPVSFIPAFCILLFVGGFIAFNPMFFAGLLKFVKAMNFQTKYLLSGHHDGISIGALEQFFSFYLRKSILPGLTVPVCLSAIGGMGVLFKKFRRLGILLLGWTFVYYLLVETSPTKPYPFYSRYVLPLIPFLCVFAGIFCSELLVRQTTKRMKRGLIFLFILCVCWPPLYFSSQSVTHTRPDTRDVASKWIYENIPQGESVLVSLPEFYNPAINAHVYNIKDLSILEFERMKNSEQRFFCVLNEFLCGRYLENPLDVPIATELISRIGKEGKLLASFEPVFQTVGFHNPGIRIYGFNLNQ